MEEGPGVTGRTPSRSTVVTVFSDLCHAHYGITGDQYPNPDYAPGGSLRRGLDEAGDDEDKRRQAYRECTPVTSFTCAAKADGLTSFPCTGSKHLGPSTVIACSCPCHGLICSICGQPMPHNERCGPYV